jgi:hypothetical protein
MSDIRPAGERAYDDQEEEWPCPPDHPEHDLALFDESDGWRVWHCRRCDAEIMEEDDA